MSGIPLSAWLEALAALGVGAGSIVLVAAAASRWARRAAWKRSIWQVGLAGILAFFVLEMTGVARGVMEWTRADDPADDPADDSTDSPGLVSVETVVAGDLPGTLPPPPTPRGKAVQLTVPGSAWRTDLHAGSDRRPEPHPGSVTSHPSVSLPDAPFHAAAPGRPQPAVVGARAAGAVWWPGAIWALGALLVASRSLAGAILRLVFSRRRCREAGAGLSARARRIALRLGLRRRVRVKTATVLDGPIAFGVLRPTVVVPHRFAADFTASEQSAILAHELAHLAARDPLWRSVGDAAVAALWWHPFVWWARHRFHLESETAADEASTTIRNGASILAGCLVALGRRMAGRRAFGAAGATGHGFRSSLGRRVERLVAMSDDDNGWRPPGRMPSRLLKTAGPVALVVAAIFSTTTLRPGTQGGPDMNPATNNFFKHSVAGIALTTWLGWGAGALAQVDVAGGESTEPVPVASDYGADETRIIIAKPKQGENLAIISKPDGGSDEQVILSDPGGDAGSDDLFQLADPSRHTDDVVTRLLEELEPRIRKAVEKAVTRQTAGRRRGASRVAGQQAAPGVLNTIVAAPSGQPGRPLASLAAAPQRDEARSAPAASGMSLDLVSLAATLTDEIGRMKIARFRHQRLEREAPGDDPSLAAEEIQIAAIQVQTAERKVDLLRRMAVSALEVAKFEVARADDDVRTARTMASAGTLASSEVRKAEGERARARGNLRILEEIVASSRDSASSDDRNSRPTRR